MNTERLAKEGHQILPIFWASFLSLHPLHGPPIFSITLFSFLVSVFLGLHLWASPSTLTCSVPGSGS